MSDDQYGITHAGFRRKTFAELLAEIHEAQRQQISPALTLGPDTVLGTIDAIISGALAEVWELAQDAYSSHFLHTATGDSLHRLVALLGLSPRPATPSTVALNVELKAGVALAPGRIARTPVPHTRFVTIERVANESATVQTLEVKAQSVELGPITALPDTITEIETRVSGWQSVTNPLSATLGRHQESDAELRARYRKLLALPGSSTRDSIMARVAAVDGVRSVSIFSNATTETDPSGIPPGAYEVVVSGGDDQAIGRAIESTRPICTQTFGTESVSVQLPGDTPRVVNFSRPQICKITVRCELNVDESFDKDGSDGKKIVSDSIALYIDSIEMGGTVSYVQIAHAILRAQGVLDFHSDLYSSLSLLSQNVEVPIGTNIELSPREVASLHRLVVWFPG